MRNEVPVAIYQQPANNPAVAAKRLKREVLALHYAIQVRFIAIKIIVRPTSMLAGASMAAAQPPVCVKPLK